MRQSLWRIRSCRIEFPKRSLNLPANAVAIRVIDGAKRWDKCARQQGRNVHAFAKSCERKNIPLVYKQLKYRVPKKNAKYPGELCCEACHYKCKALNERCVFFDTGECQHLVNAEKKGVRGELHAVEVPRSER